MKISRLRKILLWLSLLPALSISLPGAAFAANDICGEIRLIPFGRAEKVAGVWVDGQYVGYIGELKGSKKLLLLPGEHRLECRISGYGEFSEKILVEPGKKLEVRVRLEKEKDIQGTQATSEIKLEVKPERAAVFLNGGYVGHVDEFNGLGQWMVLPSGSYDLRITLPGYLPFETRISLRPKQKLEVKTELFPGSIKDADPLVEQKQTRVSQTQPPAPR